MHSNSGSNQDYGALLKIANSPDGQRLLSMIRQQGGDQYAEAMQQAEDGDYSGAREMISKIMSSPEAMQLIEKIRGSHE